MRRMMNNFMIVGIDPEPSGAYCIVTRFSNEIQVSFHTSYKDYIERYNNFTANYNDAQYDFLGDIVPTVIIEKLWIIPFQGAGSMTKMVMSYGIWLGILSSTESHITEVAPKTWKGELGVTSVKDESLLLAKNILSKIIPHDYTRLVETYLTPKRGLPKKQVTDRAEAFLLACYGAHINEIEL